MPITRSAAKRMVSSAWRRERNRAVKSAILTERNRFLAAADAGDRKKAEEAFRACCSVVDKAAKKGIIMARTANRKKSRLAARLAKLPA
jgi:small subunit ribosomal protein S20